MYSAKLLTPFLNPTVGDVMKELEKLPADMPLYFCGSPEGYLHIEPDTCCSFDSEDLSEDYEEEDADKIIAKRILQKIPMDVEYDVCMFAVNKARAEAYYLNAFRAIDDSIDIVIVHYQGNDAKLPTKEIIEDGQFDGFESVSEAIRHFLPDANFCDANWHFHQADCEMEAPDSYDDVLKLLEE